MKLVSFTAESAAAALAWVHKHLGPDAVVVNVRRLPAPGVSRLRRKGGPIEVTAGLPDETGGRKKMANGAMERGSDGAMKIPGNPSLQRPGLNWRSVARLEAMGLLPEFSGRLEAYLRSAHGPGPESAEDEWKLVRRALARFWRPPPPLENGAAGPHVFVGPPGSGKTTALCKWLTLSVLLEEREARVWRLDGAAANTAEFLATHCEMLGVPLERFWTEDTRFANDDLRAADPAKSQTQIANRKSQMANSLRFVDLPGVEIGDAPTMNALRNQLSVLPSPRVHLVLNAAYETSALLTQWRAFAPLAPEDLIFTHLDEEPGRVKLWNLVFGTNCSVRFLGAGQKIPGEFRSATPEGLLPQKAL